MANFVARVTAVTTVLAATPADLRGVASAAPNFFTPDGLAAATDTRRAADQLNCDRFRVPNIFVTQSFGNLVTIGSKK